MAPRAAAGTYGMAEWAVRRHHHRPSRPCNPRRVSQHGLPRHARVDDPGRAGRVHPPRCLPLPLRRGGRDHRPYPGGVPPAGLLRRHRIRASRAPTAPIAPAAQQAGIVRAFKQAWEAKDIGALISLLDPDAMVVADGGGLAGAGTQPIEGREQIARACVDLADRAPGLTVLERMVNGQPGLITQQDGVTAAVLAFDVARDRIKHIWAVLNPEKLRPWTTD